MARETALWQRYRTAVEQLEKAGHKSHAERLENAAGTGNPDVDHCLDAIQLWIELKSTDRPKRASTPIRLRSNKNTRIAQERWHRRRAEAGCRTNWILLQVGERHQARLYLVPGTLYGELESPEAYLELICCNDPAASLADILLRACAGWG